MIMPTIKSYKEFSDRRMLETLIRDLKRHKARIGFLKGLGLHDPESGQTTAAIAAYNEYGAPHARRPIPARPFLRPVFRDRSAQKPLISKLLRGTVFAKNGNRLRAMADSKKFFQLYGMATYRLVQDKIISNVPPPNAPFTIAKKGEGKKTLYDTGLMHRSVSYEVIEAINEG